MPGKAAKVTSWCRLKARPIQLRSPEGAATSTRKPASLQAWAKACRNAVLMPSSLVSRAVGFMPGQREGSPASGNAEG